MSEELTDKQQRAMRHLERSRSEGVTLSDYARAQGLAVREIYDALAALRRKGVLPRRMPRSKSPFVAVRVTPSAALATPTIQALPRGAMICRVLIGGAAVIECAEWPPAAWLAALVGQRADAAP
jgi:hypothetical protein